MRVVVVARPGVHEVLVARTLVWARALDPDPVLVNGDAAAAVASADAPGPLVVVWADTPRLGAVHADGLRADLESGAQVVAAPTLGGGVYLLAMGEPIPELIGLNFAKVLEHAARERLETGMLRHERRLVHSEDFRALLADPLLDEEVRGAIESA